MCYIYLQIKDARQVTSLGNVKRPPGTPELDGGHLGVYPPEWNISRQGAYPPERNIIQSRQAHHFSDLSETGWQNEVE
jgi:hypothetical protein